MKAVVLHAYGPPSNFKYEEFPDPTPGEGEVLVAVTAVSVNPVDWKMRSGEAKERFPVQFPGVLGRDVAAIVRALGPGVTTFAEGDRVMALAHATYAQLCVVKAEDLARVPDGMEMTTASAVPLVSLTGDVLMREGAKAQAGQTILLSGALGSVGRMAAFCASEIGAKVIAGVHGSQIEEAKKLPGVIDAVAVDDDAAMEKLGMVDAVANTLPPPIADKLMAKVKQGGTFGSVVGPPTNANLHPTITVNAVMAMPNAKTIEHYAQAVKDGKVELPIERVMPLKDAAEAHKLGEHGGIGGKIVLVVDGETVV